MPSSRLKQRIFSGWNRPLLHIDISSADISIRHSSGLFARVVTPLHQHSISEDDLANPDNIVSQVRLALDAVELGVKVKHLNVAITLDDSLVRLWIVLPPTNASSLGDCRAAAALRFHTLFGDSIGDWKMSADWDAARPFLACAIAHSLLSKLALLCTEYSLNLLRLEPHFVLLWNQYRRNIKKEAWIGILHNAVLTIGALDQGRLVALRQISAPKTRCHSKAWIEQQIQREALLLNLTPPKLLQVSGIIPPQWLKNDSDQLQCIPLDQIKSQENTKLRDMTLLKSGEIQ